MEDKIQKLKASEIDWNEFPDQFTHSNTRIVFIALAAALFFYGACIMLHAYFTDTKYQGDIIFLLKAIFCTLVSVPILFFIIQQIITGKIRQPYCAFGKYGFVRKTFCHFYFYPWSIIQDAETAVEKYGKYKTTKQFQIKLIFKNGYEPDPKKEFFYGMSSFPVSTVDEQQKILRTIRKYLP